MAVADLVTVRDRIAFGQGPYVASPSWTEVTNASDPDHAVRPASGPFATGRTARNGSPEATTTVVRAGNADGRYTPYRNGSPYYPMDGAYPYFRDVEYPISSGTWYPIWGGILTGAKSGFEGRAKGIASLTFQQRLAQPSRQPLKALVVGQILATGPQGFWPMDDAADSDEAMDGRGANFPTLAVKHLGVDGDLAFGVADSPGPDAGGSRVAFTPADDSNHYALRGSISTGYTGEWTWAAVIAGAYQATFFGENILYQVLDIFAGGFTVHINSTGKLVVRVSKPFVGVVATVTSTTTVGSNTEHAIGFDISTAAGTSTINLWVDGVVEATATFAAFTLGFNAVNVGAAGWLYTSTISPYNGTLANVAHWNTYDPDRHDIYAKSVAGFDSDTADVRFARVCALAGISSAWVTTTGTFTRLLAATGTRGRTLADVLAEIETAEGGRVTVDNQGRLNLTSSSGYYTPARTLTLSAAAHFDLPDDIETTADGLINTWSGNIIDGDTLTVIDADSQESRGISAVDNRDLALLTDDDAYQVGFWKVNTTASPRPRFPTIRVHASRLHATGLLASALLIAEGDQVILTDLPTSSPVSSYTGFVERVEWDFSAGDALTLLLTLSEWIDLAEWDSADSGRWAEDPGSITLSAEINSSTTSLVAVTAATHPPLTNAAGDMPFDINIDGERMTVSAVSAATSPQTLTVTRAVAPSYAAAHSAGASIAIHSPAVLGI